MITFEVGSVCSHIPLFTDWQHKLTYAQIPLPQSFYGEYIYHQFFYCRHWSNSWICNCSKPNQALPSHSVVRFITFSFAIKLRSWFHIFKRMDSYRLQNIFFRLKSSNHFKWNSFYSARLASNCCDVSKWMSHFYQLEIPLSCPGTIINFCMIL